MHTFTYSEARDDLKAVLSKVIDGLEVAVITRAEGNVVIMSKAHYNGLMETLYLLSSPKNAERLNESIAQLTPVEIKNTEISLSSNISALAEKIAAVQDITLSQYIENLIQDDVISMQESYSKIKMTNEEYRHFIEVCESDLKISQAIVKAAKLLDEENF